MVHRVRSVQLALAGVLCLVTLLGHGRPAVAKGFLESQQLAVDEALRRVFAPGHAHDVAEIDARTGRLLRTIALGWTPQTLCLDAQTHRIYAAGNPASGAGQGRLGVIDTGSGRLLRTVAVGRDPISIAVDSRAERAFVVGYGDSELGSTGSVTMVDTGRDVAPATLHIADFPRQVVAGARTGHVFVSDTYSVYMLDATSGRTLQTLSMIGNEPDAMALVLQRHLGGGAQSVGLVDGCQDLRPQAVLAPAPVAVIDAAPRAEAAGEGPPGTTGPLNEEHGGDHPPMITVRPASWRPLRGEQRPHASPLLVRQVRAAARLLRGCRRLRQGQPGRASRPARRVPPLGDRLVVPPPARPGQPEREPLVRLPERQQQPTHLRRGQRDQLAGSRPPFLPPSRSGAAAWARVTSR